MGEKHVGIVVFFLSALGKGFLGGRVVSVVKSQEKLVLYSFVGRLNTYYFFYDVVLLPNLVEAIIMIPHQAI